MKDPIKIIHKFKNNNRRIQYKNYIFVGPLVPEDIIKILELIPRMLFNPYTKIIKFNSMFFRYHFI